MEINSGKTDQAEEVTTRTGVQVALGNREENYPPVGDWKIDFPLYDHEKCVGCNICVKNCPEAAIRLIDTPKGKRAVADLSWCKGCGICPTVCPTGAIKMKGKK